MTTTLSRRKFLLASGAATLAGGISPIGRAKTKAAAPGPNLHLGPSHLEALKRSFTGRIIQPGEAGYHMAAYPNNARWADVLPQVIAECATPRDVQLALDWARNARVPFAVRSGGHNYAGFSTTRGMLINVRPMNGIQLRPKEGTVTVAAGANNQDLANALSGTDWSVPTGRCPTVGAAGLVLGGGWGFAATRSGLTCDSLVSSEVVLPNGQLVTASPGGDHADLFWGLCGGGGGNFGINTSFTFRLHDVREVTLFNLVWPSRKQIELLLLLQKIQLDHPTSISTRTKAHPESPGAQPLREQLRVATLGQFFGSRQDLLEILQPALDLVQPVKQDIRQMSYWQARDYLITDDPNGLYDIRSGYVADHLGAAALETMLTWMTRWPGGAALPENMGILFAIGGKVRARGIADTAYAHRNANFLFQAEAAWKPVDRDEVVHRQQAWLSAYYEEMQKYLLPQSYVNFPSRDIPGAIEKYYGPNLPRLKQLKRKIDPENSFRFEQSIPLG